MDKEQVTLIIVSGSDIASTNQADELLKMHDWKRIDNVEGRPAYSLKNVRMWWMKGGVLWENHLDERWEVATGEKVAEAIFPSRHFAASGKPSLTIHPIGTPHVSDESDLEYGGAVHFCPPPNPRISSWFHLLKNKSTDNELVSGFDISLEVTHHGPIINCPSLFIETGSTEATWPHLGAARVLAEVISEGLGLSENKENLRTWVEHLDKGKPVMITLGGGHYAPRGNLVASVDGSWIGHMLASYALPFEQDEDGNAVRGGAWEKSIIESIESTKKAFPGCEIVTSMDKKSFRGWQRQAVREFMQELNIPLIRSKDYIAMISDGK